MIFFFFKQTYFAFWLIGLFYLYIYLFVIMLIFLWLLFFYACKARTERHLEEYKQFEMHFAFIGFV